MLGKSRAQGALEYLIILVAVITVLAVIILFSLNVFGAQKETVSMNACKQAASKCKIIHYSAPASQCPECEDACTGLDEGIINCCKNGRPDLIYDGSPECNPYIYITGRVELFYDEFNALDAWGGEIGATLWHVNSTFAYNGTNSLYIDAYGSHYISHAQSTVGYTDIEVSFWIYNMLLDYPNEILRLEWFDGLTWTPMENLLNGSIWRSYSYALPSSASNNPNFAIRIYCYDWHPEGGAFDWVHLDTLRITGEVI